MTFSNRLRMTLLLIAVVPIALIALIVVAGIGQQIERIEFREAKLSGEHFTELLNSTILRIEKNITYVSDNQAFKLLELKIASGRRPDPSYQLPLLSLDFLEYTDSSGIVILSAQRPALVGRGLIVNEPKRYSYENDFRGKHPSVTVIRPTENGYLYGGIFLDETFKNLAEAVTRSEINFIEFTDDEESLVQKDTRPYRDGEKLMAVLHWGEPDGYNIQAYFPPGGQDEIFNNFLTAVGAVTIVALILVIVASIYFSSRAKKEISVLTDGAVRVASGDFTQPVASGSEGEFYELSESFNRMMKQLTDYRQKLIMTEKIAAWQIVGRKVAHEIKNPLTPISIAADDLHRSFIEKQPEFDKILIDCTTTIKHEVNRLKKLIDRFASFAKMPAPEIKKFALDDFIEEISALYRSEIDTGKLSIANDAMIKYIHADADQLRQVIINLLKNSFEAGCNECTLYFTDADKDVALSIEDNGEGFPYKIISEGITPYFSTKDKGSGLGLLICQRIIFDHNGSMSLENKTDGGARVNITLPQNNV
ncbi:MAG: HAMP domain-containing protein [candidate division Zixibacteria bacterium]|nr:HAMP domain-containing protein [candidate division Zixibacteria bacterium]